MKTDANGDTLWTKVMGNPTNYEAHCVQQTTDGGYIITGNGYVGVGPTGHTMAILIKTDANGNSGCNQAGTATIVTTPATQTADTAAIITSPVPIVASPAALVGSGGTVTTPCTTVGINEIALDNSFTISPNPTEDSFIILFEGTIMKGTIAILNILGVPINIGIAENIFNESKKEIHLKNISQGIYFVKVFDGEKSYCKKLIVEHN